MDEAAVVEQALEALRAAKHGVLFEGYNVQNYGGCGTPRCVLGHLGVACGWEEGDPIDRLFGRDRPDVPAEPMPPAYWIALDLLWRSRPYEPTVGCGGNLAAQVEAVTFEVSQRAVEDPATNKQGYFERSKRAILDWFDRAIALAEEQVAGTPVEPITEPEAPAADLVHA